jgi:hypothetical protein
MNRLRRRTVSPRRLYQGDQAANGFGRCRAFGLSDNGSGVPAAGSWRCRGVTDARSGWFEPEARMREVQEAVVAMLGPAIADHVVTHVGVTRRDLRHGSGDLWCRRFCVMKGCAGTPIGSRGWCRSGPWTVRRGVTGRICHDATRSSRASAAGSTIRTPDPPLTSSPVRTVARRVLGELRPVCWVLVGWPGRRLG